MIRRAAAMVGILVLGTFVFFNLVRAESGNMAASNPELRRFGGGLPGPIPGAPVTLAEALQSVDYGIPLLGQPQGTLLDPCSSEIMPLVLLNTWVSGAGTDVSLRQVGLVYNMGIWMSVTPKAALRPSIMSGNDLVPVGQAYPSEDAVSGMSTTTVRGHVAWAAELTSDFDCSSKAPWSGVEPGPILPTSEPTPIETDLSEGYRYDAAQTGHLVWLENGVLIHLTGPFNLGVLKSIATANMTWSP